MSHEECAELVEGVSSGAGGGGTWELREDECREVSDGADTGEVCVRELDVEAVLGLEDEFDHVESHGVSVWGTADCRLHAAGCKKSCDANRIDNLKPSGIVNHMVSESPKALDRIFRALAHPARRAIVRRLAAGELNLSELAEPLRMTFPAASKHVRVLERALLVKRRVSGRQHICRLEAEPLREVTKWTEQFREIWEARFEALDALLEESKAEEQVKVKRKKM